MTATMIHAIVDSYPHAEVKGETYGDYAFRCERDGKRPMTVFDWIRDMTEVE